MTTIAIRKYNDRIELAADSLADSGGVVYRRQKIYSKYPNFIFGHAGAADQGLILNYCISSIQTIFETPSKAPEQLETLKHCDLNLGDLNLEEEIYNYLCTIKDKFQTDGNNMEAFLVIFNNRIYDLKLNKSSVDLSEIKEDFYSIGSGRKFALAAMECGKSPRGAVEIAIKYDIYSGGEVQTLTNSCSP